MDDHARPCRRHRRDRRALDALLREYAALAVAAARLAAAIAQELRMDDPGGRLVGERGWASVARQN